MTKKYIITAISCIALTLASYIGNFYILLNRDISHNPEQWGQFGDFIGGVLNPTFSFLSFILLIKSLSLQNKTNKDLRNQIANSEKQDKLKSLEHQLTLLIDSQTRLFNDFEIATKGKRHKRASAVDIIEQGIEKIIEEHNTLKANNDTQNNIKEKISDYIEKIDTNDSIYNLVRSFANTTKVISHKLSDENNFSKEIRNEYYINFINITEFANLRLILIATSFCKYEQCNEIKANTELATLLDKLGMPLNTYTNDAP